MLGNVVDARKFSRANQPCKRACAHARSRADGAKSAGKYNEIPGNPPFLLSRPYRPFRVSVYARCRRKASESTMREETRRRGMPICRQTDRLAGYNPTMKI